MRGRTSCVRGFFSRSFTHFSTRLLTPGIPGTKTCPLIIRMGLAMCPNTVADVNSSDRLYALYASKNRLCMLCENTTPKKTAYNAYRNANRRVRRAEGMKMYAVGDAYKVHTECIQAYKKSKREKFLFHFFFILPVLLSSTARDLRTIIFYCPRLQAFTDPSNLIARSSRSRPPPRSAVGNRRTVIRALYAHSPSVWQTD